MNGNPWTEEDIAHLEALVMTGASLRKICEAMPLRTERAIASQLHMRGLSLRANRDTDEMEVNSMLKQGIHLGSLRRELSPASRKLVMDHARKHGFRTAAKAVDDLLKRLVA